MMKKQPSVFIQEIQLWDGIDLLIGYDYENIKETLKNNKIILNAIKIYLKPFSLFLTINWLINLK